MMDKWGSSSGSKYEGNSVHALSRSKSQGVGTLLDLLKKPFQKRTVRFRVYGKTAFGDVMYICGNLPQLGEWQKSKAVKMNYVKTNAPDDLSLWEVEVFMPMEQMQFEYKYFIWKPNGERWWEKGIDTNRSAMTWMKKDTDKDTIEFNDSFECVTVQFSIYFPTKPNEVMHVTGDPAAIGGWFKPGPVAMRLGEKEKLETDVEGQKWILDVFMPQSTEQFQYRYVIVNSENGFALWEREPNRRANLSDLHPVNSTYFLKDVNFVAGMQFDECPPDMFIGPYPQTTEDIDALKAAGVTAVLNVQTDEDFKHRNVDWKKLKDYYDKVGIKVNHSPPPSVPSVSTVSAQSPQV